MTTFANRQILNRFDRWAIRVSDLMKRNPRSIRADATIREAIALFSAKGFNAAPVINEAGRPIGVLSLTDLVTEIRDRQIEDGVFFDMQACELMTPFVFFVDVDTPVYAVVGDLLDCKIRQMYVADKSGTLIGVLGTAELLANLSSRSEETCDVSCTTAA